MVTVPGRREPQSAQVAKNAQNILAYARNGVVSRAGTVPCAGAAEASQILGSLLGPS